MSRVRFGMTERESKLAAVRGTCDALRVASTDEALTEAVIGIATYVEQAGGPDLPTEELCKALRDGEAIVRA